MNNKGFSLVELLVVISILSVIFVVTIVSLGDTFGLSSEKSYDILKNNIIIQVKQYVSECDNKLIDCSNDFTWEIKENTKSTNISLDLLKKYGYFNDNDFINPITKKDISSCLIVNVKKNNYSVVDVVLDDSSC